MPGSRSVIVKSRSTLLLSLCTCMLVCGSTSLSAQTAGAAVEAPPPELPEWVVLVLKPIPGKRVRPVTGVVVSADGLILVPADFAEPGEDLIVLDGGSDIIDNGRAALVKSKHAESGLAILSSPLLGRTPAPLSAVPLAAGTEVRLGAFPPAEQIAQGEPPLWRTVKIGAEGGNLPQVSGPLLDACGYLQGFHAAPVVQSLEPAITPAITWKPDLEKLLASVSLVLAETPCNPATGIPPAEADQASSDAVAAPEPTPPIPEEAESKTALDDTGAAATGDGPVPLSPWSSRVFWIALLSVTGATLLIWLWFRKKSALTPVETSLIAPRERKPASETAWAGRRNQPAGPAATTSDSRVEIIGKLHDGTDFTAGCAVNGAAFSVIVGRGKVDIVIDHASIHREHVNLSGSRNSITISDLGSASGTWINRVPCLPGEIMFVGEEDTVFMGDVSFRVSVKPLPHVKSP